MRFDKITISKDNIAASLAGMTPEYERYFDAIGTDVRKMTYEDRLVYDAWICSKTYLKWQNDRSPYYRIYPGVLEALLRLDLDKLCNYDVQPLPYGLKTLEIELPEQYWDEIQMRSAIILDMGEHYGIVYKRGELHAWNLIRHSTLKQDVQHVDDVTKTIVKIIYGVLSIGENPDIVKPVVLRADARKYEETGDQKYIEKAKRRGVFGFDIGADIPTREQIKRMVEENEIAIAHGRKAPHFRASHLALVHTGKGRALPKIILRKSSVINKELLTKIPQGYYIEMVEKGEN